MRKVQLGLIALLFSGAVAAAEDLPRTHCFSGANFLSWRAPDTKTIFLRVDSNRIYRVDLARECASLRFFDSKLLFRIRGGHVACSALDLDLKVSEGAGDVPETCFAKSMGELSPAEADALPANVKP